MKYPELFQRPLSLCLVLCGIQIQFGCSLLLDKDRKQCATNQDCENRGADFAGSVCVASLCVQCGTNQDCDNLGGQFAGGACVNSACQPNPDWQCATNLDCQRLGDESAGDLCIDSVCVQCATNQDCEQLGSESAGDLCIDSVCVQCGTSQDCDNLGGQFTGGACVNSVCQPNPDWQCATNQDCELLGSESAGDLCVDSVCVQCATNQDCEQLGGASAGELCVDSVCVQCATNQDCDQLGGEFAANLCVESVCQPDPRWACVDDPPIVEDPQAAIEAPFALLNVATMQVEPGVHVSLCGTLDLACRNPLAVFDSDEAGNALVQLPEGFTGYLVLESDAIMPQVFFPDLPIVEGEALGMAFVNPAGALGDLATILGEPEEPGRGLAVVMVNDCLLQPAMGTTVEFSGDTAGTLPYYALDGIPSPDATVVDATGVAGLFNVPPGTLGVTVKAGAKTLGSVSLIIRDGYMSFAPIQLGGS